MSRLAALREVAEVLGQVAGSILPTIGLAGIALFSTANAFNYATKLGEYQQQARENAKRATDDHGQVVILRPGAADGVGPTPAGRQQNQPESPLKNDVGDTPVRESKRAQKSTHAADRTGQPLDIHIDVSCWLKEPNTARGTATPAAKVLP